MTVRASDPTPDFSSMDLADILKLPKNHLKTYVAQQGGGFTDAAKPSITGIEAFKGNPMVQVSEGTSRPKKMSTAVAARVVRAFQADPEGVSKLLGLTVEPVQVATGEA